MTAVWPFRLGAVAAVVGAAAQFVATVVEPDWGGDPQRAVRVVAASRMWNADRLLDLIGLLLTLVALTVAARALSGAGREWVRVGTPLLHTMAALGAAAILTGAVMRNLAQQWQRADAIAQPPYLAAFDAMSRTTENLFFGAFLALGAYLAALAPAIMSGSVFCRWTGRACGVSAVLLLGGDLLSIVFDPAFVAVLAGYVLFLVAVAALGIAMWRQATSSRPAATPNLPSAVEQT